MRGHSDSPRTGLKAGIVMPLAEQRGGAEVALVHLLDAGRETGIAWTVILLEIGSLSGRLESLGIDVEVLPAGRMRQPLHVAATVARLVQVMRRRRLDVVLSWMTKAHLYGGPAAMLAGVPAVWYQHGIPSPRSALERLATLVPARQVLACSRSAATAQRRLRPRRDVAVVHPSIDFARFDSAALPSTKEARARLSLPTEGAVVGMVGRLQCWKRCHVLVEAMPRLLKTQPDTHCVIVGGVHELERGYAEFLERRVADLGLDGNVTLTGFQEDVALWMQAMDVVVHAATNEPFGLVILEAMALGKPVVAGAQGGPAEIVTDGQDGLLADPRDPRQLEDRLLLLLSDRPFARALGARARERARRFSTESYVDGVASSLRAAARDRLR